MDVKKYSIILADSPWSFDTWADSGKDRSYEKHYQTMSLEDIAALPVKQMAADNCALFFWAIWPRIFDAQPIIESWGFEYKTLAWEWLKVNRKGIGLHMGMGYYTRANPEPCLLAVRGKMPIQDRGVRNLLMTDESGVPIDPKGVGQQYVMPGLIDSALLAKVGAHSAKPLVQYKKISALYPQPELSRVELFARRKESGWDVFGNEAPNSIDLAEYWKLKKEEDSENAKE